ncbi:MAG: hypothetical protein NC203_00500 [Firmicutes bacterium]|nr:hypothetical protein [[Eubacterium] siraeum]MCM1486819.1 hypothetical protein [Bacillota bacterium]
MNEIKCPVCGAEIHGGVNCGMYSGATVCAEHCTDCEYFSGWETSVIHCYYLTGSNPRKRKSPAARMRQTFAQSVGKDADAQGKCLDKDADA